MQRSTVLFPDPLRPMITATSPRATLSDTPANTGSAPKLLCTSRNATTGPVSLMR